MSHNENSSTYQSRDKLGDKVESTWKFWIVPFGNLSYLLIAVMVRSSGFQISYNIHGMSSSPIPMGICFPWNGDVPNGKLRCSKPSKYPVPFGYVRSHASHIYGSKNVTFLAWHDAFRVVDVLVDEEYSFSNFVISHRRKSWRLKQNLFQRFKILWMMDPHRFVDVFHLCIYIS